MQSELNHNIRHLPLPQSVREAITAARKQAGTFYAFTEADTPLLIQSQDGTASGKSYNVFAQYIESVNPAINPGNSHRNLVFITPLKSQIDIPEQLIARARDKKIELLPYLSQGDIADLGFTSWVKSPEGKTPTNRERYRRWIKQANELMSGEIQLIFQRLKAEVDARNSLEVRLETEIKVGATFEQKRLEDELRLNSFHLAGRLQEATVAMLNALNQDLAVLLDGEATNPRYALATEMVKHLFPFQIALYRRCILLATTKKFDGSVLLLKRDKEGDYHRSSQQLDHVLGQKKGLKVNPLGEIANQTNPQRIESLKEQYWITDEDSPFAQRDIRFTLVLDEEHEAYRIFQQNVCQTLMNDDQQLPSLLAILHRVLEYVDECSSDERAPGYTPLKNYVDEINKALLQCDLRPDFDLKKLTRLFRNSLLDIVVDSRNAEQVIALIGNIFSYQIQRFYRESDLRRIHLRSHGRHSYTEVYVSEDDKKVPDEFNLYELYQTLTALLLASARLETPKHVCDLLVQQEMANQNNPLSVFIRKAQSIKGDIVHLSSSEPQKEQLIDDFFTYFQPKTLFSLSPREQVRIEAEQLRGWVLLKFRMELIKELPEIALLRVLYNTRNTIILLSATAGFPTTYNGQYSRPFLDKYARELNYRIRQRDVDSASPLSTIRDNRNLHRPVALEVFDDQVLEFLPQNEESEFRNAYRFWLKMLEPYSKAVQFNRYHKREFHRQLQCMLLAAYTGRHILCIGISSRFFAIIGNFLRANKLSANPYRGVTILDNETRRGNDLPRVFEITPFAERHRLRVVMFDSKLNREDPVRDYLQIDHQNLAICMVSHFQGAGTGLNYYVTYPAPSEPVEADLEQIDFDELAMVCGSYWSQINATPSRNTLENYITLLKHYAHGSVPRQVGDFDTDLVDSDAAQLLNTEHTVELHKIAMQTIGRTERRDAQMNGIIRLPSGVHHNALCVFRDLDRHPNAQSLLASLSLHNHLWFKRSKEDLLKASFSSDSQRSEFENKVAKAIDMYSDFEAELKNKILPLARQGDRDAIELNEALRHRDSFTDPQSYIKRLKRNAIIKKNAYLSDCVSHFYLERTADWENVILAKTLDGYGLTDISAGANPYKPEYCLPQYHEAMAEESSGTEQRIFAKILGLDATPLQQYIPIPSLLPLLIGNIGEWQLHLILQEMNITLIPPQELSYYLDSSCYELFDVYCINKNRIVAIDVKNWRMQGNNRQLAKKMHNNSLGKVSELQKIITAKTQFDGVDVVYLNTRYALNSLNIRAEHSNHKGVCYYNLFKNISSYEKDNGKNPYDAKIKSELRVNQYLLNLLGANYD